MDIMAATAAMSDRITARYTAVEMLAAVDWADEAASEASLADD